MMRQKQDLLRVYIRELLKEDDGGMGGYGGLGGLGGLSDGMIGPYGMEFVNRNELYDIFVQPFANVFGVAAGKVKELTQKTITLGRVVLEAVATTFLFWLRDDYAKIFENEKERIDKIRSEYGHYYDDVWNSLGNSDVMIAAFMYNPGLFLTTHLAKKAPRVAANLLSILTGGHLDDMLGSLIEPEKNKGDDVPPAQGWSNRGRSGRTSRTKKGHISTGGYGMGSGGGYGNYYGDSGGFGGYGEGNYTAGMILVEDEKEHVNKKNKKKLTLVDLINNDKVQQAIKNNSIANKMSDIGQEVVQNTLSDVFEQAQSALSVRSLDDVQKKMGKKLPEAEKLKKAPEKERQKAEQQLMLVLHKTTKEFYVKQLISITEKAVASGVPRNHPFIKDYESVIAKIKKL